MNEDFQMIPIERIRILNPRHRDKKKFEVIVESIRNLGLKKPIQVSLRSKEEAEGPGYDLVCGQGRIEAFIALGYREIPAVVVNVSREERLLRSLVENMARRRTSPLDLIKEIERLHKEGYNFTEIGKKLDCAGNTISGLYSLSQAGEERLLEAAIGGKISLSVAIDISKANSLESQRQLLKAFEAKQLNHIAIRKIMRLIDRRRLLGKQRGIAGPRGRPAHTSAEGLVTAYKREGQRQRLLVKKAKICDGRLLFITTAFRKLMSDAKFVELLHTESLQTMPANLWDKVNSTKGGKDG